MISGLWKNWSRLIKTGLWTTHRLIKTGLYQSGPVIGIFRPVLDWSQSWLSPIWVQKPDWTGLWNTKHIPLNKYLHKFKRMDKANCLACGEENETIAHFLLHCPKYAFERWALAKHAKKRCKELTIETLLGDLGLAIPLANYMDSTGRFRTKIGEHPQSQIGNSAQENHSR